MMVAVRWKKSALAGLAPIALLALSAACRGRAASTAAPAAAATPGALAAKATFVGREKCAPCHAEEDRRWEGSHHDLAMEEATEKTVLGNFDNASFTHFGVTSTFFRKDGKFFVRTDGPDGKLHEFPIAYTFGVYPLQQYLIAFPGGRYQALNVCWDTRSAKEGGQRWFHLYPNEEVAARRPTPLDRAVPELELHVRRMPFDEREEGLLRSLGYLRDDLVGDRRLLRGLPRPGLGARRVGRGRQGGEGEERGRRQGHGSRAEGPDEGRMGLRHEDRRREEGRPAHLADRDRDLRALPRAALGRRRRVRLRPAAHADAPASPPVAGNVFRRRPDRGRGLRVRLLPPEQDARGGRDLLQLP